MLINFSLLKRNANYRFLYLGQFVSFMGTMITGVALPYQIYSLTHSTLMVGLLSLFQLLPLIVTALIGGVLADRRHRKVLLIASEVVLSLGCLLFAWNASLSEPHIWVIFVVAMLMSSFTGLHRPALDGITQQIVAKEDFSTVGALASFLYSTGSIAGPAIGGLVISHFGLVFTFILDFGSFFFSLCMLSLVKDVIAPTVKEDVSAFSSLLQGFRYAISRQELLGSYLVDFIAMIFGMPLALFPAIALSHGGVKTLGMLYSAPAVGALLMSFFSGWTSQVQRLGRAIAISAIFWGVAIIFFGISSNLGLALFFLALAGGFDCLSGIFRGVLWNQTIPNHLRGRLSGIEMISYMSGPKLGDTEAGLVAAVFGVTVSIVSGGILCVAGVGIACYYLPKFWKYHNS